MEPKPSRSLTRRAKLLLLFTLAVIVSALALSLFHKSERGTQTHPAQDLAVAPDLASATTALHPDAAGQAKADVSGSSSGKKQVVEPRVIPLRFEEFDQRILLSPKEIVTVQIDTGDADNVPVRIDAPNGGSLNRHKAPAVLQASEAARGVQFAVGPTRGLYTLEVNRGGQTRIFEFWVDRETPVGQPGPERTFVH
jgi:hypothetical protein